MNNQEWKREYTKRMKKQFCFLAFDAFCVIVVISMLLLAINRKAGTGGRKDAVSQEKELPEEAQEFIERVDNLFIAGNQTAELENLQDSYEMMSDEVKRAVTEARYEKLQEALELQKKMDSSGNGFVIKDQSKNQCDILLKRNNNGCLLREDDRTVFAGQADMEGEKERKIYDGIFNGTQSFTVEAVINPNDQGYYNNMIASKGDNCMGLRISKQQMQFFVKVGEEWKNIVLNLTEQQLHSWLHVAGIYDGKSITVYVEGSGSETLADVGAVKASDYAFAIGHCPETGRSSSARFQSIHVYTRALTEKELDEGTVRPEDECVAAWYDFGDYSYPGTDLMVKGIRTYTEMVKVEEGETVRVYAEPIPYYAKETVAYQTEGKETILLSESGLVTGKEKGSASVAAEIPGTDFCTEISVQVGDIPLSAADVLGWIVERIVWIDLVLYMAVLFVIAFVQRRQAFLCVEQICDAVGKLGKIKGAFQMAGLPGEVRDALRETETYIYQEAEAVRDAEKKRNSLMAYMAHDLKTPVTSIMGYLTLLKDEKHIPEEMRIHYAETALDSSVRMDELIDEFFEIARFNMSNIVLDYKQINVSFLLVQLVSEIQPMLLKKGLTCRMDVPEDILLYCDPNKLERVFDNLLRNAMNYSYPYTEIVIRVATGEQFVFVCENEGDTISEDKLDNIFEQFYRLDTARSSSTGGTGLGLAIAKKIVELHQGKIQVESRENKICFTVILPWSIDKEEIQS